MNQVFSVSEFNLLIKSYLQELGVFNVRGEVTEFTITQRKGVYLTISDGKANLKISGFFPNIKGIELIEKGMNVVVSGTCDIYVPYGSFSLSVYNIEPEGEGALAIAYQKLKQKLFEEGLFEDIHKSPLPEFVTKIALLTGNGSAAYSDFTKILNENQSGISIDYYPVIVQGENSVEHILQVLRKIKNGDDYDAIVLTRGGGSLEDLKSFNSEELAREIFTFKIPVLVGVGHEKDESIADFVADVRASTPSQCAYYLIDQNNKFINNLIEKTEFAFTSVDELIKNLCVKLDSTLFEIESFINQELVKLNASVLNYERLLKSYDLKSTLKRGFAILEKNGDRITSINNILEGDKIKVTVQDGSFVSQVKNLL